MSGMRLQLDASALDRLIGGDTEVEVELRQSIVNEFTKRHLKGILSTASFKKFLDTEAHFVRENLQKQIDEHIGTAQWKQGKYVYTLTPEILERLHNSIDAQINDAMEAKLKELRVTIKQAAQDIFDANLSKLDAKIEQHLEVLTNDYLNKKMVERMNAVVNALG